MAQYKISFCLTPHADTPCIFNLSTGDHKISPSGLVVGVSDRYSLDRLQPGRGEAWVDTSLPDRARTVVWAK